MPTWGRAPKMLRVALKRASHRTRILKCVKFNLRSGFEPYWGAHDAVS